MMLNTAVGDEPVVKVILDTMRWSEGKPKPRITSTPPSKPCRADLPEAIGISIL